MSEVDELAGWLGAMPESHNVFDITDEAVQRGPDMIEQRGSIEPADPSTSRESLGYIASYYDVPARRGQQIRFAGALAVITGASGPHLRARMIEACRWAEAGSVVQLHPTWDVEYGSEDA